MKEPFASLEKQIRSLAPHERAQLLVRLAPVIAAILTGFALIDVVRQWFSVALAELLLAGGLYQAARMCKPLAKDPEMAFSFEELRTLQRAEGLLILCSLPLFWLLLLDPGVGHASMFGLILGPAAWYIAGGTYLGRWAALIYLLGWLLLALLRGLDALPIRWLYPWEEWAAGLAIWLLAVVIFDARERTFEGRREKAMQHDAAIAAFLDRLPLGVGIWDGRQWLYRNPALSDLCHSPEASPAELLGEETWLALLQKGELEGTWRCGELMRPVKLIMQPVPWSEKEAHALLVVDETAARELERLRRDEMLAALASGVAHHFNNLFAAVLGATEMIVHDPQPEKTLRVAQMIVHTSERGARICRDLVRFAERRPQKSERLDPAGWLQRIRPILNVAVPPTMKLKLMAEPTAPIEIDPRDLDEIALRIVHNAVEASRKRGEIHVGIAQMTIDDPAGWHGRVRPGSYVVFSFSDQGPGMGTTTMEQALAPFFTGKEPSRPGMGLSVVWGLVQRHHGLLRFRSRKRDGMEVDIAFPALSSAPAAR